MNKLKRAKVAKGGKWTVSARVLQDDLDNLIA